MGEIRIVVADRREERSATMVRDLRSDGYDVIAVPAEERDLSEALRELGPDLVLVDAERLRELEAELAAARRSRSERAEIDRAKDVLMTSEGVSETEAHRALRRMAMSRNMRLIDVARAVASSRGREVRDR